MDTRQHIERAYGAALAIVESHELQHLSPYQLASHIYRARQAHLEDIASPAAAAGMAPVDPTAMAAAEDHPEDAVREGPAEGGVLVEADEPAAGPGRKHPRRVRR